MRPIEYEKNSFDYIRLYAAIQVLVGHYYVFYLNETRINPLSIFSWFSGVIIFFTISGFLACASMDRHQTPLQYLRKRLVRILPPYYLCVIINTIVIFIIYPILPSIKDIVTGLITTIFAFHVTPSYLSGYATGSSNGSLWSIFVILQFYIFTAIFYPIIKKWNHVKFLFLILFFILINIISGYLCNNILSDSLSSLLRRTLIPYMYIFLIGMYIYIFRDSVLSLLTKYWYILIMIYLLGNFLHISNYFRIWCYTDPFTGILTSIITFSLAYKLGNHHIKYDFSYGIFLYHFAVMNVMIQLQIPARTLYTLPLILLLSLLMSIGSLFVIERPFTKKLQSAK